MRIHPLLAEDKSAVPLFVIGGGYTDARNYSSALLQAEYKSDRYIWQGVRPQAVFMLSEYGSGYLGFGLGWEFYLTKQIILIPSISPVYYWRGSGKDLGSPLEFRSCIEICYELKNAMRLGMQLFHVSNASLGYRNPGFNALTFCIGIPIY